MNPILADLYGTGMDKLAHEDEGYDLSELSDEELLLLADDMEYGDDGYDDEDTLSKMASDGDLEYWDMAGRIMAHAYSDEFDKVASADEFDYIDADYIDLNDLDAEDLYELAMYKEAGVLGSMVGGAAGVLGGELARKAYAGGKRVGGAAVRGARSAADRIRRSRAYAVAGGAGAAQLSAGVQGLRNAANKAVKMGNRMASRVKGAVKGTAGYKGGARAAKMHARGIAFQRLGGRMSPALTKMSPVQAGELATRIAMGGGAAAALGAGGAAAYGMNRNRNR